MLGRRSGFGRVLSAAMLMLAFVAIAGAAVVVRSTPAHAADCSQPADVQVTSDACAGVVAVSVMGNASGDGQCTGPVSCVAVSGTGDASNTVSGSCDQGVGCVAVSGTGSASNTVGDGLPGLCGRYVGCVAASGTGSASNTVSGGYGVCTGYVNCVAVSGTGDASNTTSGIYGNCSGYMACVAVSGIGNASNSTNTLNEGFGDCSGGYMACVAVSGTGSASNTVSGACVAGQPGAACLAISGTGSASNQYRSCTQGCRAIVLTHPTLAAVSTRRPSMPVQVGVVGIVWIGLLAAGVRRLSRIKG